MGGGLQPAVPTRTLPRWAQMASYGPCRPVTRHGLPWEGVTAGRAGAWGWADPEAAGVCLLSTFPTAGGATEQGSHFVAAHKIIKINEQMHADVRNNFMVFCICLLINKERTGSALSFSLSVNYSSYFDFSEWLWIFSYYHYSIRNDALVSLLR